MNVPCLFLQRLGVDDVGANRVGDGSHPQAFPVIVARHAELAAQTAGVSLSEVMGPTTARRPSDARRMAWRAIIAETGCTKRGLARVWGCDHRSVQRGVRGAA